MYVYFNEKMSDRVLVRLGLNNLIGWLQLDNKYIDRCMYVCTVCMYIYVCNKIKNGNCKK